jgi:hypothetical protein
MLRTLFKNKFIFTKNYSLMNVQIKNFTKINKINKSNKKPTVYRLMKEKIKTYGLFGIYCYIFSYIATFGIFYALTKLRIIKSESFFKKAEEWGLNKYVDIKHIQDYIGPNYSDLIVALAINEVFELIRLPIIVAILPRIVKKYKK